MGSDDNFAYLLPFIFLTFGVTLIAVSRWGSTSARNWGTGFLLAAGGFAFPIIFGFLPVEVQALVCNALFLGAFYFYGEALLVRFKAPRYVALRLGFCAIVFAVISYLILVDPNLPAMLTIADLSCAALLAFSLLRVMRRAVQPIDRILLVCSALVVLETVTRTTIYLSVASFGDMENFVTSPYAFFMQLAASIFGLLLALGALGSVAMDVIGDFRNAAEQDPLSGLLNRRGFERVISALNRGDWTRSGVIISCDIDHFKRVNDTFGHASGDLVIAAFARLLGDNLPREASVARFGGEEFVAFLPNHTLAEGGLFANVIRLGFAAHDWSGIGIGQQITASFGVAGIALGDHSLHDAVGRADKCLYAAKTNGRNNVMMEGSQSREPVGLRIVSVA